jgi:hypothetical protein
MNRTIQDKLPARSGMKGEHVLNRERYECEIEEDERANRRFKAACKNTQGVLPIKTNIERFQELMRELGFQNV